MFTRHVDKELSAYCHHELSFEESRRVREHVLVCQRCRKELEDIKLGVQLAGQVSRIVAPETLWSEIETALDEKSRAAILQRKRFQFAPAFKFQKIVFAGITLIMFFGAAIIWQYTRKDNPSWEVARLSGAPIVGSDRINVTGRLSVGEWLETDAGSRALIDVADIGQVEVGPNARLRLLKARANEHRLALERGRISAVISAPPRLFFVDTPSGVAADLGCAYTLEVDATGASLLHVTAGLVALQLKDRETIVPAGAVCATRPGTGPGTPYFDDASAALKSALSKLDFEKENAESRATLLGVVLSEARQRDALTLWHLLSSVNERERARVYERLAELVPPSKGVTRDGVLRLDKQELDIWKAQLMLD